MKKIYITAVLLFIGLAILFFKYIGRVAPINTSTIKKYTCPKKNKDIIAKIKIFCQTDSNCKTRVTDTTGTLSTGHTYYLDVEIHKGGRDIKYSIACEENRDATISESNLRLILAYDKINNTGGYNKGAAGIDELSHYFDNYFIVPFGRYYHLTRKI